VSAPGEVVAIWSYAAEDDAKAFNQHPTMRAVALWFVFLGVLMLGMMLGDILFGGHTLQEVFREDWQNILLALLAPSALFISTRLNVRHMRRAKADGTLETHRFSRSGFAWSAEAPFTPWGLMNSVTEVPSAFIFTDASSQRPVYLPRRALSNEQLDELRDILKSQFATRPEKLKLRNEKKLRR
jgi:hypothetical protein